MIGGFDLDRIVFGAPHFLWLLVFPGLLLAAWVWRFVRRLSDLRRIAAHRTVPVRERFAVAGDLPLWLLLVLATGSMVIALARPTGTLAALRRPGLDIVILQDGSASMQVADLAALQTRTAVLSGPATRWQRSMQFLRVLGDSLSWADDRIALTVFAHIATPQIRLTRDPNTVFFFLNHLQGVPPFRLADDTTWDTNVEQGIAWGLRLIEKDEEIHGPSANAKLFVLLSDGEAWSGEVARSLARAGDARVPVNVIGVGTLGGGKLPVVKLPDGSDDPEVLGRSRLDRASLQRIAAAGGGQYFELDRDPDRDVANAIIDAGRRLAPAHVETGRGEELYWRFVVAGAGLAAMGLIFVRDRVELWMLVAGAFASAVGLWGLLS
ncbi:MAG: vWA domain-containing protein [Vicinamibacterales bacterium]